MILDENLFQDYRKPLKESAEGAPLKEFKSGEENYCVYSSSNSGCDKEFTGTEDECKDWIKNNRRRFPSFVRLSIQAESEPARWMRDFDVSVYHNESINESADAVKRILQPRVTKYGIRPFGDNERLPRGFRFRSGSGTSGLVTYNGRDYVYAIKNDEVRVMDSSKAGHNWSETIYKESINEAFESMVDLNKVLIDLDKYLGVSALGEDNWIEVFPTRDEPIKYPGNKYMLPLEITGPNDETRKAKIIADTGEVDVIFINGSEAKCHDTQSIAQFIAGEFGVTLNESMNESANEPSSEAILYIEVMSGVNADGFTAIVKDSISGKEIFRQTYYYGYDASYDRRWASSRAPYVTDIINDLKSQYNVSDIEVTAGKNMFRGDSMSSDSVEKFKNKYLNESISLSEKQLDKAMALVDEIYEACQRIYRYNENGKFKEGLNLNEWSVYSAAADLHDMLESGSLTESTETDETPWSYKEVEDALKSLSNNWKDDSGVCRCYYKEEKQHAVKILKQHYKIVETSQDGDWTVIAFETPIQKESMLEDYLRESNYEESAAKLSDRSLDNMIDLMADMVADYEGESKYTDYLNALKAEKTKREKEAEYKNSRRAKRDALGIEGKYPYYITLYHEYPIYEPAEGGYYYSGLQAHSAEGYNSFKEAAQAIGQVAEELIDSGYNFVKKSAGEYKDYGDKYIGTGSILCIENNKQLRSRERGYQPYE